MPFTLSHTIVAYPLKRFAKRHLSTTGLIMGSMVPDFEFFVRITLYGVWGHTFWGIFLFDLPLALLLAGLFHTIVRNPLIENLPDTLYFRFHRYESFNWITYLSHNMFRVIFSILLGIITHLVWDNFTHEPDYISPIYWSGLLNQVTLLYHTRPLYSWLQQLCSIAGMAGFLIIVFMFPSIPRKRNPSTPFGRRMYWLLVVGVMAAVMGLRYWLGVPAEKPFGQFIVISISAFMVSLVVVSGWYSFLQNIENNTHAP